MPTPNYSPILQQSSPITINYVYDPLQHLKEANYSNGDYYHYTGVYPEPVEGMRLATD